MSISEKIKAIIRKTEESKAEYNLDGQTAKVSASPSVNVSNSEILTGKDVLFENDFLKKTAAIKRFEYSPLGKDLKKKMKKTKQKTKNVVLAQI